MAYMYTNMCRYNYSNQWRSSAPKSGGGKLFFPKNEKQKKKKKKKKVSAALKRKIEYCGYVKAYSLMHFLLNKKVMFNLY